MNRPVPILFLIHSLGHGGSERQLAAYARNLDQKLFLPHAASVIGGFRADEMRAEGIPVIKVPLRGMFAPNVIEVSRELRAYIKKHRIGIVHAFDYGTALFGVLVARSAGVIALSSQRFFMDSVPRKYQMTTLVAHWLAHGVITNSEELKRYLHDRYKYPAGRIDACPNGLDPDVFCPAPQVRPRENIVIGTVCVLRPGKNLRQLIEAFARVRSLAPGVRLVIVGSGPEEQNLKMAAGRLGITAVTNFVPSVANVTDAMRGIDIFVHTSLSEGMPNAVMEAMACGCAVVATRVGGTPELIEHGVHGLLVEPGNVDDLAEQIETLLRDPDLRTRMAEAGSRRIRSEFSLAASCRRLEQIYARYLSR